MSQTAPAALGKSPRRRPAVWGGGACSSTPAGSSSPRTPTSAQPATTPSRCPASYGTPLPEAPGERRSAGASRRCRRRRYASLKYRLLLRLAIHPAAHRSRQGSAFPRRLFVVERRSAIRAALVWDAMRQLLQDRHDAVRAEGVERRLEVVDLGGGTGGLAVRIAELGHHVVVVDPSPDALASLERRAADADVNTRVRGVLGDAGTLLDVVRPAMADVVVCHGVLEVVDVPALAVEAATAALAPGGVLSVLAA